MNMVAMGEGFTGSVTKTLENLWQSPSYTMKHLRRERERSLLLEYM